VKPKDPVKVSARRFVSELATSSELENDLDSEDRSEKLEAEDSDPVRPLNNEECSARLEPKTSELVSVLKIEFFAAELPLRPNDPTTVLNREFFTAWLEAVEMEEVGFRVHIVAAPGCRVHETGVVLED